MRQYRREQAYCSVLQAVLKQELLHSVTAVLVTIDWDACTYPQLTLKAPIHDQALANNRLWRHLRIVCCA